MSGAKNRLEVLEVCFTYWTQVHLPGNSGQEWIIVGGKQWIEHVSRMVFESIVADVLNRFVGEYVENLDKKQLKIGIWGGKYKLTLRSK